PLSGQQGKRCRAKRYPFGGSLLMPVIILRIFADKLNFSLQNYLSGPAYSADKNFSPIRYP
ncbi:MAG: hypothetical protein AMS26_22795, partial [Bacteroides sp. SM23_62]